MDPKSFDSFVGQYQLAPSIVCSITAEGDQLFTQLTGQQRFPMFPMSAREFFLTVVDARVSFEPEIDGRAPAMILHQNGRDQWAKRLN